MPISAPTGRQNAACDSEDASAHPTGRPVVSCATIALLALAAWVALPADCPAGFLVDVTFHDPGGANAVYYDRVRSHVEAAGALWGNHINGSGSLQVEVRFNRDFLGNDGERGAGGSDTDVYVYSNATHHVFETGAAHEINTGVDPNGSEADVQFAFNTDYLANELWFDPNPFGGTEPVPADRTDALSVMVHEFGHAIGFNGWRDWTTGAIAGTGMSKFDELVVAIGGDFFFTGASAMALFGGPVPLTFGNIFHFGNNSPRPGSSLIPDLMNGVVFQDGIRYDITPLDRAVMSDLGLSIQPAAVPEPSSLTLLALAGAGFLGYRRRRCRAA